MAWILRLKTLPIGMFAAALGLSAAGCEHVPHWARIWPAHDTNGVTKPNAEALYGTKWIAEEIDGKPSIAEVLSSFEVAAEGRVSGQGGCNRYFGRSVATTEAFAIANLGATKMACLPPLMDQEAQFFDALGRVRGFVIGETDGKLRLLDATAAPVVVLRRDWTN
jgi:putative lipoprotein